MSVNNNPSVITNGLVFSYDMLNTNKSWIGRPSTNTCNYDTYNYTDGNATVTRGATPPIAPPVSGYEISKIQSNNGGNTQYDILYTSNVDQVNGGVYTHSAWILLTAGSYCQVGQHWNPWDPGPYQYIPTNVWTRVSYTVTNSANNYGNIANSYGTDGTIYVTAVQYEAGSTATPFMGGKNSTRSNTQAVIDLTNKNTITANSLTYNSDGTFSFNGSSDYMSVPNSSNFYFAGDFTVDGWIKRGSNAIGGAWEIGYYYNGILFRPYLNDDLYINGTNYGNIGQYMPLNTWCHFALVRIGTSCVLYINGSSVWSATVSGTINSNSEGMYIGKSRHTSGQYYTGSLNSIRVYKDVGLTALQVRQNFNSQRGRYGI